MQNQEQLSQCNNTCEKNYLISVGQKYLFLPLTDPWIEIGKNLSGTIYQI
jgi:hypothetical protein